MKFNQFLVLAAIVMSCALALDINISNRYPQCMYVELGTQETLNIQYEVTGYKAEEFRFMIYDNFELKDAKPLYEVQKLKTHTYALTSKEDKEYKICFQSLDNSGKILQFELTKANKEEEAYADNKNLQATYNDSVVAYYSLNDIYSNLRHSLMKIDVQTKKSTENKVKWCSVIKMVLMISITTIQIVFLTGLFKDYSPLGI